MTDVNHEYYWSFHFDLDYIFNYITVDIIVLTIYLSSAFPICAFIEAITELICIQTLCNTFFKFHLDYAFS